MDGSDRRMNGWTDGRTDRWMDGHPFAPTNAMTNLEKDFLFSGTKTRRG